MATGKRASMREGPLADLFRKTTEDEPEQPTLPVAPETRRPSVRRLNLPRRPSRRPAERPRAASVAERRPRRARSI